jgi:hypothetical protein
MRRALLIACFAVSACPASAAAAYRPTAEVAFDRTTPLSAPAITSVMRVPSGDDTTRTITARFPSSFTYNAGFAATGCKSAQASTWTCPESSRIGTTTVKSPFGDGTGDVFVTDDFRLVLAIQSLGGIYRQRLYGTIRVLDDGSFELTFDDLPPIPVTESRIALEGGPRAMLVTPRRCGDYQVTSRFVSHAGAAVEQKLPVRITGCPERLKVESVRIKVSDPLSLRWQISGPATGTELTLFRWSRGAWDEVSAANLPATRTTWRAPKRPGRYSVTLRALGANGAASPARTVRLTVGAKG